MPPTIWIAYCKNSSHLSSIVNAKIIILKGSGLWTLSVLMPSAKLLIYVLQKQLFVAVAKSDSRHTRVELPGFSLCLSWLVEMLISLPIHLWLYHFIFHFIRMDLFTTLVLTPLEVVAYWLFLYVSTLCGHAERIWTCSALSLYLHSHFFVIECWQV